MTGDRTADPATADSHTAGLRLGVYLDQGYWRAGDGIVAERSFVLFLDRLAERFGRFVLLGRVADPPARGDYALGDRIEFVALPGYRSGASAAGVGRALPGSLRALWRVLGEIDALWLLGPSAVAVAFAFVARLHGTPVVLGVRQDLPSYARGRHPARRLVHRAADALDAAFRALARRRPVIVVGAPLAARYRRACSVLPITVSLVPKAMIEAAEHQPSASYAAPELTVLVVSRLDAEKNPLLVADVLAAVADADDRWRMVICGDGPLRADLEHRLRALGVEDRARVLGHVALDGGLLDLYRDSHALLHVSWTEGVPQVLFEAFASHLPVVATDVGGVAEAADGAALLIPPGSARDAAEAILRLAGDERLRDRLVSRGAQQAARHTVESETAQVASFIAAAADRGGRGA